MNKGVLRGEIFEIFILKLVLMCGYHLPPFDSKRMKKNRKRFLEYKGRGGYHQIDIPVDSDFSPDFIYPIRLLGEVKSEAKSIDKSVISHEIGVMMDIQQNYTDLDYLVNNGNRKTELFAVFSGSGFNLEAEKLAYAHNIKTISFKNNPCIGELNDLADKIAGSYCGASKTKISKLLDFLFDYLILNSGNYSGFDELVLLFSTEYYFEIYKTIIFATTSTGLSLFFISKDEFPFSNVFKNKDSVKCKISCSNNDDWYLYSDEAPNCKLYFSMPELVLKDKIVKSGTEFYPKKTVVFENVYFKRNIDGIERSLGFSFDKDWFDKEFEN